MSDPKKSDSKKSDHADKKKELCFVIGPIGKDGSMERKHSDLLLHAVIKHALQNDEFAYIVKRADEDADPGMIGDRVVSDIINAELVVADLTDLNANAFYELGIRHSTQRPTIHIAKAGTVLPFDTVAHRTIFVDLTDWHSIEQARDRVAGSVRAIRAPEYKVSNPITQANVSFKMRQSDDPRDRLLAQVQERMGALENIVSKDRDSASKVRGGLDLPRISEHVAIAIGRSLRLENRAEAIERYRREFGASMDNATDFFKAVENREYTEATMLVTKAVPISPSEASSFVFTVSESAGI